MIKEELFDILLSDKPSELIRLKENEMFELIPELGKCKGCEQNTKWHKYDVYVHILHVVDNVDKDIVLRLAALFHDIGKPLTKYTDEEGVDHFPRHWEKSRDIFIEFAREHHIDTKTAVDVSNLIYYHDVDFNKDDNLIIDTVDKVGIDNLTRLFNLKKADVLAQADQYHYMASEFEKEEKKYKRTM